MGDRGRKPASELALTDNVSVFPQKPKAPDNLTPEQTIEWDAVVGRMPADWFLRETHGILANYCRHVISASTISSRLEEHERKEGDVQEYDRLLKMREREVRSASSLATRLRITQQTTYDKSKKKGGSANKLWDK